MGEGPRIRSRYEMADDEKIVSLSDAELGRLGFLGEHALGPVAEMVRTVKRIPKHLQWLTVGQIDCLHMQVKFRSDPASPVSPISPTFNIASSTSSASTVPSEQGLVSPREKAFFLTGISSPNHPHLLHRSDVDLRPFVIPPGRHTAVPTKSIYGIKQHSVLNNEFWKSTVAPDVIALLAEPARGVKVSSMIPVRVATTTNGQEVMDEHVTLLISVFPESTAETSCRDVNAEIISIFTNRGIGGIAVYWIEGKLERLAGSPPMMKVVDDTDPTAYIRRCMCAILGISVARQVQSGDGEDRQGTLGLYFHVLEDKKGEKHVYGFTNQHVVSHDIHADYEFSGRPGDPKKYIGSCGSRRFQQVIDETNAFIAKKLGDAKLYAEQLVQMEADSRSEDPDEVDEAERAMKLKTQDLERVQSDVGRLEKFLSIVKSSWSDAYRRVIGHLDWVPAIRNDVDARRYTRDIATFELDRDKFEKHFQGNVMYLAGKFERDEVSRIFYPNVANPPVFEYPANHLFQVKDYLDAAALADPCSQDDRGNPGPGHVVAKFGQKTDLSFAQYSALEAYTCSDHLEGPSWECAFFNLAGHKNFSDKGDSGAAVVNAEGKLVAFVHSGMGMPWGSMSSHVTFGTPAHFVIDEIKGHYPTAIFFLTTF